MTDTGQEPRDQEYPDSEYWLTYLKSNLTFHRWLMDNPTALPSEVTTAALTVTSGSTKLMDHINLLEKEKSEWRSSKR